MPSGRRCSPGWGPSAAVLLVLGCAAAPNGAAAPPMTPAVAAAEAVLRGERVPGLSEPTANVAWSYRAGAPLAAPPALGSDGTVVVGSVDGYLHALRRDGSFLWGYTLHGPLVGRPAIASNGEVFAAADRLYALEPDGTLAWVSAVAGGVTSPPVIDRQDRVWVTTGQGTLLGFSERGGIVGFAHIGHAPTLGPAALAGGGVAIASVNGDLKIAGHPGVPSRAVATGPVVGLEASEDALLVLGGEGLSRFDTTAGEERWSRTDVARVACPTPALVVVDESGLRWLSPRGEPLAHVAVTIGAHRPIACLPSGAVLVADDAGNLLRLDSSGVKAHVRLPEGRLISLDPTSDGSLIAAYRDGRVLALRAPD